MSCMLNYSAYHLCTEMVLLNSLPESYHSFSTVISMVFGNRVAAQGYFFHYEVPAESTDLLGQSQRDLSIFAYFSSSVFIPITITMLYYFLYSL